MIALAIAAAAAAAVPMTIAGPRGDLSGTYLDAGRKAPQVLIIPGSGPTDRDGNNPLGVTAAPYRLLAEALAGHGVSTLRADKRGLFGSKAAIADPNAVTLEDYAADAHNWAAAMRKRSGAKCVWLLGHSEGGFIALVAAQKPQGLCGLILVAAPGRKFGSILREQLNSNPANAPILPQALAALDALEAGKPVDSSTLPVPLQPLFRREVQPYVIEMLRTDPAALAARVKLPILVVQGSRDLQVSAADAAALHKANPHSRLLEIAKMNHVLKDVATDDRAANLAAYADPSLPVDAELVDSVAAFVKR
jgi:pimeloyl-ACP methyl ester carboxylesterase